METLEYIIKKFGIDLNQKSPFYVRCERNKAFPELLNELEFKTGVEIGVYKGEFSQCLLEGIPGLKLYGVDLWEPYSGYGDYDSVSIVNSQNIAIEKTKNYSCEFIKGRSDEVANQFKDGSLDFVYIDGNHSYEYVVSDIAKWSKKVRKGGIVAGHDFNEFSCRKRSWRVMHVANAVDGWTKSYKIHPWFVLKGNINKSWMYVKI